MQRFPCPFCGLRPETEFHFAGEAGKARPDSTAPVADDKWSTYLYRQDNPKGLTREVWVHLTCQEYFVLERDSATMAVGTATTLRKAAP